MITEKDALSPIPDGLRRPLLDEYASIVQNFMERRWGPSELSGGKFCEIVYTILDGYNQGTYPSSPSKPTNFVDACRKLEQASGSPRSFQILIPRLLPALYEIRNNRGVGHTGGDVDPNHMDAIAVVNMANWVMAELVRVFHALSTAEAQEVVDSLIERRIPIVWEKGGVRRVLDPSLQLGDQILLLLSSTSTPVSVDELRGWLDYGNKGYFERLLAKLHKARLLEYNRSLATVEILPPGSDKVLNLLSSKPGTR